MRNKFLRDKIYVIETNIDDMSPVVYETVFEKLYGSGALEVFLTPVQMKKIRPGILLTALIPKNKLAKIAEVIFRETTSFGIRYHEAGRLKLIRKKPADSDMCCGIKMNKGYIGKELVSVSPEYSDCRKLAAKKKVPLKSII
ncbi:MAG: LarC family nickel insertion protein [Candidatus Omnitrophica bacterium]|nr:LarC family nickel insertion protein [Candidatus Omnitrophota bacterium]